MKRKNWLLEANSKNPAPTEFQREYIAVSTRRTRQILLVRRAAVISALFAIFWLIVTTFTLIIATNRIAHVGNTTPEPTNIPVGMIQKQIVSVIFKSTSGGIIGDGTVRVFAPSRIQANESALVELNLSLDNLYIPTEDVDSKSNEKLVMPLWIELPQRMGASLFCGIAVRFDGCDKQGDEMGHQIRTIKPDTLSARWSWILAPKLDATGSQVLEIDFYTLKIQDKLETIDNPVINIPFVIIIDPPPAIFLTASSILLIIIPGGIMIVISVGLMVTLRRARPQKNFTTFISYRREPDWTTAELVRDGLHKRGVDAFVDVRNLAGGDFEESLKKAITKCEFFVIILSPTTIKSAYVKRETLLAQNTQRKIIPLLNKFDIYNDPLPKEFEFLRKLNAVKLDPEYQDASITKLYEIIVKDHASN